MFLFHVIVHIVCPWNMLLRPKHHSVTVLIYRHAGDEYPIQLMICLKHRLSKVGPLMNAIITRATDFILLFSYIQPVYSPW